jgi:signal transduction histidine kinase
VVQDLAGVAYSLAGAARKPGLAAPSAELFDASAAEVRESIKSLRSLLVDIYPPTLAEAGLESALADLLAGAGSRGVTTALDVADSEQLPDDVARLLYRCAQEAVRNALAHAQATSLDVQVRVGDGHAVLEVADDGTGFDPAVLPQRASEGHLGLRGVTDLAARTGGRLEVRSTPGRGTVVRVEVPVP